MDNKIISGKNISESIKQNIKKEIHNKDLKICICVIQVGDVSSSNIYIQLKKLACENVGIKFKLKKFKETIKEEKIINYINWINYDEKITGIIVQLPLPSHLDKHNIINNIDPRKDIDGLTDFNLSKLILNDDPYFISCTPLGIMELLKHKEIELEGKNVTIIGRSKLVGMPLFHLLLEKNCTITLCHSKTKNINKLLKYADIVICAIGIANFINGKYLKKGCIAIDVGINKIDNQIVGDFNYKTCLNKVSYITPVPGGVGPMTISMILLNLLKAYKLEYDYL
jgi:methylenetetrahydrofolate dehydrogenase (NADP+) / methenyltetrahydrofolate cyclohydrolase